MAAIDKEELFIDSYTALAHAIQQYNATGDTDFLQTNLGNAERELTGLQYTPNRGLPLIKQAEQVLQHMRLNAQPQTLEKIVQQEEANSISPTSAVTIPPVVSPSVTPSLPPKDISTPQAAKLPIDTISRPLANLGSKVSSTFKNFGANIGKLFRGTGGKLLSNALGSAISGGVIPAVNAALSLPGTIRKHSGKIGALALAAIAAIFTAAVSAIVVPVVTISTALLIFIVFAMLVINSGGFMVPPGDAIYMSELGPGGVYPKCRPTKSDRITQGPHPGSSGPTVLNSLDFGVPEGTKVYATHDGTVIIAGKNPDPGYAGYGHYVQIQSTDGSFNTIYGHLLTIYVSKGQQVTAGSLIALSNGDPNHGTDFAGNSTGPHLHYEVGGSFATYNIYSLIDSCFAGDLGGSDLPPDSQNVCSYVGQCLPSCGPGDLISEPENGWADCTQSCCRQTQVTPVCKNKGGTCIPKGDCSPSCVLPFLDDGSGNPINECNPQTEICCDTTGDIVSNCDPNSSTTESCQGDYGGICTTREECSLLDRIDPQPGYGWSDCSTEQVCCNQ